MSSVVLDPVTIGKLTAFNGSRVEVRDETGKVHGFFQAEETMTLEEMLAECTPEQLARRADSTKPRRSMDEVMRHFGMS